MAVFLCGCKQSYEYCPHFYPNTVWKDDTYDLSFYVNKQQQIFGTAVLDGKAIEVRYTFTRQSTIIVNPKEAEGESIDGSTVYFSSSVKYEEGKVIVNYQDINNNCILPQLSEETPLEFLLQTP